jgi:hypothetical protein
MFALAARFLYGLSMNRRSLYMLYVALWAAMIWLFYFLKPSGGAPFATLAFYGLPVMVLYLFSLFLIDVRAEVIDGSMIRPFLNRRKIPLLLFLFGLIVLVHLLSRAGP